MIPVFVSGNLSPVAYATKNQRSAEVAGKALKPTLGLYRRATYREDRRGTPSWHVSYFEPTKEQVLEWENRWPRNGHGVIAGPAQICQTDIAH